MASASPSDAARTVAARTVLGLVRSVPPTLGPGRLVCVDGPAGSGKTTLAEALGALDPEARVVHMDDLYDGWLGLERVRDQVRGLLRPLAAGRPGRYRRYDWHAGAYAETVTVPPGPLLVLEGVGAGLAEHARSTGVLVWVRAEPDVRRARWLARDGEESVGHQDRWMRDEAELHARERTRERSDVVVDGVTGLVLDVSARFPHSP